MLTGQEYHNFIAHDNLQQQDTSTPVINGIDERPDTATKRSLDNAVRLNLVPVRRLVFNNTSYNNGDPFKGVQICIHQGCRHHGKIMQFLEKSWNFD